MKLSPELRAEMTEAMVAQLLIADREWTGRVFGENFTFTHNPSPLLLAHLRVMAEAAMNFTYGEVDDQS